MINVFNKVSITNFCKYLNKKVTPIKCFECWQENQKDFKKDKLHKIDMCRRYNREIEVKDER